MMSVKSVVEKEKDVLFNEIRHLVSSQHGCPKHMTMVDLNVILAILKVKQYDDAT